MIYERDPQLRQVIGNEVQTLTLEEKYQILQVYMNGGGVQGLLEADIGAGGGGGQDMDSEDERNIEEEFKSIYDADPKLREVLGGAAALAQLNVKDKYQILVAYRKGGGV